MHFLPDKKLRQPYTFGYVSDFLAGIAGNNGLDHTKIFRSSFFSDRSE